MPYSRIRAVTSSAFASASCNGQNPLAGEIHKFNDCQARGCRTGLAAKTSHNASSPGRGYNPVKFPGHNAQWSDAMKRTLAAIALALAFGILTPAKPHHPQQDESQAKVDVDGWRHFLLHAAGMSAPVPEDLKSDDGLAIVTTARKFRAEFEKAVDDFNAAQETRLEADQLGALKNFLVQRDAMVAAYRSELLSAVTTERRIQLDDEAAMSSTAKSVNAGPTKEKRCGLPDHTVCTITYSMFEPTMGRWDGGSAYHLELNADHSFNTEWNQILDGAAAMADNPEHSRHTPTVTMIVGALKHDDSGKSVCENCYLYVNSTVTLLVNAELKPVVQGEGWKSFQGGEPGMTGAAGTVVCSETGKVFDTEEYYQRPEVIAAETHSE
jgi:hypothetical protein